MASFLRSRETVVSISLIILVILFLVTGFVSRAYHQKLDSIGKEWFETGMEHLKSGNAAVALADFHDALVYRPDDAQIQFQLAQALLAEGHDTESRAYLLGLLTKSPSDAPINLALARISAQKYSEADALRYYHGAIYGIWPEDPEGNRLKTRLELCRFLVERNDASSAEPELIALASQIPPGNATLYMQVAEMFSRIGDQNRALAEYRRALDAQPSLLIALRGAGLIEYQLGDFRDAERYLEPASRMDKTDAQVSDALEMSRLILSIDPSLPGLSDVTRRARVRQNFEQADSRLESCAEEEGIDLTAKDPSKPDFAALAAQVKTMRPHLTEFYLTRHPDQVGASMNFVFRIEDFLSQNCKSSKPIDRALTVLSKYSAGASR